MSASEANASPPPQPERASVFDIRFSLTPGIPQSVIIPGPSAAFATVITVAVYDPNQPITVAVYDPNQPKNDGPVPASKKSIADMPLVKITEEETETGLNSEPYCVICLGENEIGGEAKEMPCKHRFHPNCIDKWLGVHRTCPVCRYEMPVEEEQRVEIRISPY